MIRRPLLFVAAGYCAAIFISFYLGTFWGIILGAALTAGAVWLKPRSLSIFCVSFLIGVVAFALYCQTDDPLYDVAKSADKERVEIFGTVKGIQETENEEGERHLRVTVAVREINGSSGRCRTLVNYYSKGTGREPEIIPGDSVIIRGTVSVPQTKRNPGCFDYRLYLRAKGIRTTITADSIEMAEDSAVPERKAYVKCKTNILIEAYNEVTGALYRYKKGFIDDLSAATSNETGAMMSAILFGDKNGIDDETMDLFRKNGTAHILAVSGLHIGIIYAFILKLWILLGSLTGGLICGGRGISFLCFNGAFFFCYMILASFSPSVVRAVCMVLLHAFATMTGRRYDLCSASFAVLMAVLIHNPFMLFDLGLQMSFLAVLSMNLALPYVRRLYSGIFMASMAVQIGLWPFVLYHFNYLSIAAILINVPVIILAGIIVPAGICCSVIGWFFSGATLIYIVPELLCDVLVRMNELTAAGGMTSITLASPPVGCVMFYYLALLLVASEEGRLRLIRSGRGHHAAAKAFAKALAAATILAVLMNIMVSDGFENAEITFVDVGQGDCMCIKLYSDVLKRCNGAYLIDGGGNTNYDLGKKTLREYLLKNGISHVDGAFVTHLHTDHYLGVCQLAKTGMVDRLYVYEGYRGREGEICRDTGLYAGQITYLHAGQTVTLRGSAGKGDAVTLAVLWPQQKTEAEYVKMIADETNENDMSLLMKVTYGGVSMLATGDMDEKGESAVIARRLGNHAVLKSDILKVGHHGSKTSTSDIFLNYVNPKIAVIQVGENNMYGHPTPETLQRLASKGIPVYRNDLQGAVGVEISGGKVSKMRTMNK